MAKCKVWIDYYDKVEEYIFENYTIDETYSSIEINGGNLYLHLPDEKTILIDTSRLVSIEVGFDPLTILY